MRLGFGTRIALIVIVSLLSIQTLAFMAYFVQRGRNTDTGFRLPLPDQVAAMVELLEKAAGEERRLLLRAFNGPQLRVRLIEGQAPPPSPETWQQAPRVERTLRRYLAALGGREVTVLVETKLGPMQKRRYKALFSPAPTEVHVRLKTGETLVVDTTDVLYISVFGFPPGFWAGVLGFVIALLTIIIVRREAQPLRQLAKAVDAINLSDDTAPIADAPKSAPEIRALITAFNRLRERIAKLLKNRMAVVGGISHDLRTYATRLRLRAEKIADETERANAVRDIDDMIALLDNAMLAIKDGASSQTLELVDLNELLEREAEDRRLQGANVTLSTGWRPSAHFVLGDALALRRMISNLTENAITYGQSAAIRAWSTAKDAIIVIDDQGPGIAPDLRHLVTEPFVRLEASRSRKTGGAGLGLAIAKNAAEAHGGNLIISEAPEGGARIMLKLPLFDQTATA